MTTNREVLSDRPSTPWPWCACGQLAANRAEVARLRAALTKAVRLMDDARGHYGIEECAGPCQPDTEWDEIQEAMYAFAASWREALNGGETT